MIYTVTLNPSLDLIVKGKVVEKGRVNLSESEMKLPGGKGINVSQVIKNLGSESVAFGFLGGFTGRYIEEELGKKGVDGDFIYVDGDTRINIKLKEEREETEINGNSPKIEGKDIDTLMEKLKKLKSGDILVLSGSVPKAIESDIYGRIIENSPKGVKVMLDTKGAALLPGVKKGVFAIKPNNHELEDLFEKKIETLEDIVKYGKKLMVTGAENVIISMAGDGAILINKDDVLLGNVPKGKLVNSVGAGDSLVAGFTYGIEKGYKVEEAFRYGIASGSASAYSDELCKKEEVERLLGEITLKTI